MTSISADATQSSPWLSAWFKPREAIAAIVATNPRRHVLLLAALGWIATIVSELLIADGMTSLRRSARDRCRHPGRSDHRCNRALLVRLLPALERPLVRRARVICAGPCCGCLVAASDHSRRRDLSRPRCGSQTRRRQNSLRCGNDGAFAGGRRHNAVDASDGVADVRWRAELRVLAGGDQRDHRLGGRDFWR